ncbi:MAG TPA: NADH-quinone oxidoreductase subunit A [Candidatus Limnocylindria bacterium]|nr:NADH-quinone oxidoreductase subunit A [Candidatus Limnocylindria bacterium]
MHFHFANVLVFFGFGILLCALMLGLGMLLRPSNPNPNKLTTYECGEPPSGSAWINFNIRFYLIALVFVIFDVELAFIYPVMAVYKQWVADGAGGLALAEIVTFIGILAVGLVYVWAKGDLAWLRRTVREARAREPAVRRAA